MASPDHAKSTLDLQELTSSKPGQRSRNARMRGLRQANGRLSVFLLALIALSPIPLGSNRPAFWAISALLIGLTALVYALSLIVLRAPLRFSFSKIAVPAILFFVFVIFLIIQIIPFGDIVFQSHAGFEIISKTLSIAPGETALMVLRQLGYGLFFFLMLQVSVNQERAEKLILAVFLIVSAHALYAMIALTQLGDVLLFFDKDAYLGSATGTFVNRNSFATFLALGAVAGLCVIFKRLDAASNNHASAHEGSSRTSVEQRLQATAFIVALLLILIAAISTQSRMGVASLLGGCMVTVLLLASGTKAATLRLAGWLIAVGLAAIAIFGAVFGAGLFERFQTVESSFDVRMALYAQTLEMIADRPFLGFGGGSFNLAYPLFHRPPVNPDLIWDKAHSTYLALWSEVGVVFGSMPLIIFAVIGFSLWRLVATRSPQSVLAVAAMGALVVVALHSLFDFGLEIQANTYLFLCLTAIGLGGAGARKTEKDANTKTGTDSAAAS